MISNHKHNGTADSNPKYNIVPKILDRDFTAAQPNQKWVADISYAWTREG